MTRSKFFTDALLLLAGLLLFAGMAFAQTVTGQATLTWVLPTVPNPASAITGIEVYASTSPIADTNTTLAPLVVLGPAATTTAQTIPVANGSTLYFRLKAVNAAGKSAFSNQASKLIDVAAPPGAPTSLTVTIAITPAP